MTRLTNEESERFERMRDLMRVSCDEHTGPCLVRSRRKSDGKEVALVAFSWLDGKGGYVIEPLAELLFDDAVDLYEKP